MKIEIDIEKLDLEQAKAMIKLLNNNLGGIKEQPVKEEYKEKPLRAENLLKTDNILRRHYKHYNEKEIRYLKDNFHLPITELSKNLGRTIKGTKSLIKRHNLIHKILSTKRIKWNEENTRLARDTSLTDLELAERLGTKESSVTSERYKLGVPPQRIIKKYNTKYQKPNTIKKRKASGISRYRVFMSQRIKHYYKLGINHRDAFKMGVNDWNKYGKKQQVTHVKERSELLECFKNKEQDLLNFLRQLEHINLGSIDYSRFMEQIGRRLPGWEDFVGLLMKESKTLEIRMGTGKNLQLVNNELRLV